MNLFSWLFRSRDKPKNYLGGLSFLFGSTTAGQTVNEKTSMQLTAVYACVRVLAESIAGLPVHIYRNTGKGKERVADHPLYRILHDEPNPDMTSFVFRETMMSHLLLWGNAHAQILKARG
ncbi:MAG: phage portal protein, partial [Schwartzia sp.]|nr:phage portal protein [Schwartzia sp. (in: firmicutes)]